MRHWDAIEAFVTVIQKGSFTAAADYLNVSPSHVSRRVSELESQLGTPLIYRTTRSIRLSEVGEQYFDTCNQLLQDFVNAEQQISQNQSEPSGSLKITCATTFGERFIAPYLPEFLKRYPKVSIDLHLSNEKVDLIRDGYDLAVRMGTLEDSSLVARRLCNRTEYLCASPDYLEKNSAPHTLSELSHHNCLIGSNATWLFLDNGVRKELRIEGKWRSNSGPALLSAVKQGLGIAQLPDYYVEPLIKNGELISLLDSYRYRLSGVWLVYPKVRHQLPKLQLLCEHLIHCFEKKPLGQ